MTYEIIQRSVQLAAQVPGASPGNVSDLCTAIYNFVVSKGSTSSEEDAANRANAFDSVECALRLNSVGEENLIDTAGIIYGVFSGRQDPE